MFGRATITLGIGPHSSIVIIIIIIYKFYNHNNHANLTDFGIFGGWLQYPAAIGDQSQVWHARIEPWSTLT